MRVLAFSAHVDDAELGCGGTLAKHAESGDVRIVCFCMPRPELHEEFLASLSEIGACGIIHNYKDKHFSDVRQNILDVMEAEKKLFNPDIVYVPSIYDTHQDHMTVHVEATRAFRDVTLRGYELPWNNMRFSTDIFSPLDRLHLDKKLRALSKYETQAHRRYFDPQFIEGLSRVRGVQSYNTYAEAFEVVREIAI